MISEFEFPTVGQIAHAQELRGAEVVHVRPDADGRIPLERFAEAIDERTALVCCTAISYRTGYRLDVAEVARLAHEQGALCLADRYQAAGAIPLDVRALGVDFLTAGTVKYLLASAGLAFMYVRRDLHERLLPDPDRLVRRRGHLPDGHLGLLARVDRQALRRGDAAGAEHLRRARRDGARRGGRRRRDRGARARPRGPPRLPVSTSSARRLPLRAGTGEYGPLVCVASTDAHALVEALHAERIVTSSRDANLRISLHLYNVEEDLDRILEALARNRHLLA